MRRGSSPAVGRGRQQELERPPARLRQRQAPSRRAPVRDNQILPRHLYPLLGHSYTSHLQKRKEPFMKLFYSPGACSLSPHIVSREAGIPVELVKVDLKARKYDGGGDYLKINSKGYVPALQLDSGQVLTEGPAIVQYLAD